MATTPSAFLVVRRDDGFGDVHPLLPGERYVVGRSPNVRIVLRDDLCSRELAEVHSDGRHWFLRDKDSLNGTYVNEEQVPRERKLVPLDEVRLGRSRFVFTDDLNLLLDLPARPTRAPDKADGLEIKKRLGNTRFLPAAAVPGATLPPAPEVEGPDVRVPQSAALGILYQLGLEMSDATTPAELCELVVDALFRATPAEVAAVLAVKEGRELEPVVYRNRRVGPQTYHKVSQFVSHEVQTSRQAVLAENVAADHSLKNRDSIADLRVASLVCAPVMHDEHLFGLVHLYRTSQSVPLNGDDLELTIAVARQLGGVWHRQRRQASLSAENQSLRDQLRLESELVGGSAPLKTIETQVARVAATKATVLIRGESGVGKELVARAIHKSSPRRDAAFVCLNCAALTETLLESELFGHEKGAFTGATERMAGKFESADGGTIFLDEIGEMAPSTQAKFLRVLEGHPFERVGGNTPITADVRVVAATNAPLEEAVRSGGFRRDLFFRLQVVQIDVPPLRDRADDVPLIADHFLKRFARETNRKIKGFSDAALAKLKSHRWPGNVRELRNVVERAVALGSGSQIEAADIWLSEVDLGGPPAAAEYAPVSLEAVEKKHIEATLKFTAWNKSKAADVLGIQRSTLDRKIKEYGLKE
jgi:Nif-specific regulatory protein